MKVKFRLILEVETLRFAQKLGEFVVERFPLVKKFRIQRYKK